MEDALKTIGLIIGAGGAAAVLTVIANFLISRLKLTQNYSLASAQQEHSRSMLTMDKQGKRIERLEDMHADCIKHHEECLRDSAKTRQEMGRLMEAVRRLEGIAVEQDIATKCLDESIKIIEQKAKG
jgi:arginine deiminase